MISGPSPPSHSSSLTFRLLFRFLCLVCCLILFFFIVKFWMQTNSEGSSPASNLIFENLWIICIFLVKINLFYVPFFSSFPLTFSNSQQTFFSFHFLLFLETVRTPLKPSDELHLRSSNIRVKWHSYSSKLPVHHWFSFALNFIIWK